MSVQQIDAKMLSKLFLAGAGQLNAKKDIINELNVFPVPDGDTGTNMTMTIMSAAKEVVALGENPNMADLCKAISSGSLRGARGNSGVILSQLFRGFTKVIKEEDKLDTTVLTLACEKAVESAYKAVMKPKEGTILTVAKGVADKAAELHHQGVEDLEAFFSQVLEHANYVLSQTPEMLPVLKQAGVVDSGGQGLVEVLSGAFDALCGKEVTFSLDDQNEAQKDSESGEAGKEEHKSVKEELKYAYSTQYRVLLYKSFNVKSEMDFKTYLESLGHVSACDVLDHSVKVKVLSNDPGLVLQKALKFGDLTDIVIENLRLRSKKGNDKECANAPMAIEDKTKAEPVAEEKAVEEPAGPKKAVGFISVAAGDGLAEIFKSLGVDYVIEGGQTMNPSTADILDAVDKVNADTVFILPNNKNIILAANQAAELVTNKNLLVIPTKTVPQGIAAVINFVPDSSNDENEANMLQEISHVKTGQVTYAVRDTMIDDKEIKKDDYMGIGDNGLLSVGTDVFSVTEQMVNAMVDDSSELISIYYGSDVSDEDAELMRSNIEAAHSGCDVELQRGGQPIYYYIISVE